MDNDFEEKESSQYNSLGGKRKTHAICCSQAQELQLYCSTPANCRSQTNPLSTQHRVAWQADVEADQALGQLQLLDCVRWAGLLESHLPVWGNEHPHAAKRELVSLTRCQGFLATVLNSPLDALPVGLPRPPPWTCLRLKLEITSVRADLQRRLDPEMLRGVS